jgi:hypothetical protein
MAECLFPAFADPVWVAVMRHEFADLVKLFAAHCRVDLGPDECRPGTIEVDRIIASVGAAAR